ncbi:MAG: quinolinate synthase NadA [Flavobacteriales bacterium]|nr:Quinolinate synthase A [Flavobacteriales bacterium]MCC6578313.1 quinolinate synthase NadA [Flavobacteriales bacterium]NUQ15781.1 quinolinate synthase NadA [Flavobacteriales bacterium]
MNTTLPPPEVDEAARLTAEILRLKREKNAVILAHYYQTPEIQSLADHIGDSLALAQAAERASAPIILFCGVHFMAETAKILNPGRKVLVPDMAAGCSLADSAPADLFRAFRAAHPHHVAVTYINCSAEVKAMSDIICTSSNAVRVVQSIPADRPVLFAPDKHLGAFVQRVTGRELLLWDGVCEVHVEISADKLKLLLGKHPQARLIAHPECPEHVLELAHHVGSTASLLRFVQEDPADTFIVATEAGILHNMRKAVPHKTLIAAPAHAENTCACSECPYMKLNTLEKVLAALRDERPEIVLDEDVRVRAHRALRRMLELG